jgi:hypothetical protein
MFHPALSSYRCGRKGSLPQHCPSCSSSPPGPRQAERIRSVHLGPVELGSGLQFARVRVADVRLAGLRGFPLQGDSHHL